MSAPILYCGLDVHKDSITAAVFRGWATEPELVERLGPDPHRLRRFFERLAKDGEVRACYEASGAGYVLQRQMTAWGFACELIAPSLIPTRPGEKRKHDRRDAIQLGRLYRGGELTVVRVPTAAEERVRDLVRCRETFQKEILRARHYLLKFLRRRGFIYRDGNHWTERHFEWLRRIHASGSLAAEDQLALGEYLSLLEYEITRRDALDARIEAIALSPAYAAVVERLRCFRGLDTHAAIVLATEIGDWRRFAHAGELMAYMGLVPTENSSGERRRLGAITKAGNTHCRHVLVQAAWSYRHRPAVGAALKKRQADQDARVVAHAWKAQHRLYSLFHRVAAKKPPQVAAVAVARELVGFLWAVAREVPAKAEAQQAA